MTPQQQRAQLAELRRKVDFDSYDVTVDELIRRVAIGRIDVAPVYQRQFRWDKKRQSFLIESLLLGIPVPPLFMATNALADQQNQWEVVDGLQRLLTLVNFAGAHEVRSKVGLQGKPATLESLEKLTLLNACQFAGLPADIKSALEDRSIKVIVLNDKSDLAVRFDLFERLNTGGMALTAQEVRECIFRGPFMELLTELAKLDTFNTVVALPENKRQDGTPQEYVLRFFAFYEKYEDFDHSVVDFLNDYTKAVYLAAPKILSKMRSVFVDTFQFLADVFPSGLKTRKGMTPVNLFEGVSVGAACALRQRPTLKPKEGPAWVVSEELRHLTTGATNSKPRVSGRIEYCRDRFLGK